jgi:hypothetical protein
MATGEYRSNGRNVFYMVHAKMLKAGPDSRELLKKSLVVSLKGLGAKMN